MAVRSSFFWKLLEKQAGGYLSPFYALTNQPSKRIDESLSNVFPLDRLRTRIYALVIRRGDRGLDH